MISFALPLLWASSQMAVASSVVEGLGRFHLLVLHLPIGAYALALLLNWNHHRRASLVFTAITALLSSVLGWMLAESMDADAMARHRWWSLGFTAWSFVLLLPLKTLQRRIALMMGAVLLIIAGHEGASLTHGEGFLLFAPTKNAPPPRDDLASQAVNLLQQNCAGCHGQEKQKGDYRLDARSFALLAGESGQQAIVPGAAMESHLVRLITLERDDDEVMPPAKKEALQDVDILSIIHWIDRGALWPEPSP